MTIKQNCFEYWNLAKSLKLPEIVALWCDIEPSEFGNFYQRTGFMPSCADAKRVILEDALLSRELDYIDEGTPYNGGLWIGNPVSELIEKNRLRINKDELKRWFIQKINDGDLQEIPAFLDIDKQALISDTLPKYHTVEIQALHAVLAEFWNNLNPYAIPPKKETITSWIKEHYPTISNNMADAIDTMARPAHHRLGGQKTR